MLEGIVPASTLLLIAAFLSYLGVVKRLTAFSFALAGLLVLEFLHQAIRHHIANIVPEAFFDVWGFYIWYLSFALTDFAYVWGVSACVKRMSLSIARATEFLLIAIFTMGLIQVVRMIDRLFIDSQWISILYTKGIPLLNMGISVLVVIVVLVSFFSARAGDN